MILLVSKSGLETRDAHTDCLNHMNSAALVLQPTACVSAVPVHAAFHSQVTL